MFVHRGGATRLLLACLLVGLLGITVPNAGANHDQGGVSIDSLGGNEYWVEVQLSGNYDYLSTPQVRDTDGAWVTMDHPSWAGPGHYAKSYHVEPGHKVQFRLQYYKSDQFLVSCWFTHPAGIESCDGSEVFTATAKPFGDREHIRVAITANQEVSAVYYEPEPGGWPTPMTRATNGSWTSTLHVPDGTAILFVVDSAVSGDSVRTGCYVWPSQAPVTCPTKGYATIDSPTAVNGDNSKLNAFISDDGNTVAQLRFDGGAWRNMTRTGPYDVDFDGAPTSGTHIVQFRATTYAGDVICMPNGWYWPRVASPSINNISGDLGGYYDAVFANPTGNANWVQINGYAMGDILAMEAQVNGGSWVSLQQQSWCDWGKAISAPAGSQVRFRAFFGNLSSDVSEPFTWPPSGSDPSAGAPTWKAWGSSSGFGVNLTNTPAPTHMYYGFYGAGGEEMARLANGSWFLSKYVPSGMVVRFTAEFASNPIEQSPCYRTPTMTPVACPAYHGDWIEDIWGENNGTTMIVQPTGDQSMVQVRFDGGDFLNLTESNDPFWAWRYYSAPSTGSHVAEFRFLYPDGTSDCMQTGYIWPQDGTWPYWIGLDTIVFAEPKGNTGYVQINTYTGASVAAVEVSVNGGAWKSMEPKSWCDWGLGISAASGSQVRFRAFYPNLTSVTSQAYTWPPGGSTTPPPNSTFDATFTNVKGNEWWVQANVATTGGTLAKVDVSLNGGAWQPLKLQSWGGWAASYHIVAGTIVQLRATSTTGGTDLSACYRWLEATTVTCPGGSGGGTTPWTPTLTPSAGGGKVSIAVTSDRTVTQASMETIGNDAVVAMSTTNGGATWSATATLSDGALVRFSLRASDGATFTSGCYKYTASSNSFAAASCTPTTGTFTATFKNVRGNEWWVETDVTVSGGTLAGVDARVNGGAWVALTKQSYGSWAKSIHVLAGQHVEFRATSTTGQTSLSASYTWPPA